MKTGKTLQEMAAELERQRVVKRDFIAPTTELKMNVEIPMPLANEKPKPELKIEVNGHGAFEIGDTAHDQLANRLGIPRKYYDRMQAEAPHLLAENVNHWMKKEPEKRMVRTLDGRMRAFLSSRFRPLDNFELAEAVLPVLMNQPGLRIESSELTERRMYIKAVTDKLTYKIEPNRHERVKPGVDDIVQAGIVISNSEIGAGSVKIEPMIFRLVCYNGLIAADASMRKYHVGRGNGDAGDLAEEFFRDETRNADDKAFWMKVRDVVNGAFNRDVFERIARRMQDSVEAEIVGDPVKVVEVVQRQFQLNDSERSGILTQLIKGGDLTQYGLLNAITRHSQDVKDYDRATELERMGGLVLELPKSDWQEIANPKVAVAA